MPSHVYNPSQRQTSFFNNTTLETCNSLRLLGVTVSSDLSWNCHVNNITKKCNKLLGFIRVVTDVKNPYFLLKLYRTLSLPILYYCPPVWNVHENCNVEKLEQIQHRATRMILCQRRGGGSNNTEIDSKLKISQL